MTTPGPWIEQEETVSIDLVLNGMPMSVQATPRRTLAEAIRDHGLTGTHVGCADGSCGTCTVVLDDQPIRSCLTLALQAAGGRVETVEGLADSPESHALQRCFHEAGAVQCGFCTPGFLMLALGLLREEPTASPERVREVLTSNLCRCTGGRPIVNAVLAAQRELAGGRQ